MPQADVAIMPWPWTPGGSEATIRSQYEHLRSLGINSFLSQYHYDNYQNGDSYVDWYSRIYTLAEEYGIKVYWYSAGHRMDFVNQVTEKYPIAKHFLERFGAFPACGGWFMLDEPSAYLYPWADIKALYDKATSQDPVHPKFSVWVVAVYDNWRDRYYYTCHPSHSQTWCMIEDVCSIDCYPWRSGQDIEWLRYYVEHDYSNPAPYDDAPGDCPKLMIPCMQAWIHFEGEPKSMPDDGIVQQYNVWKDTYGYSGFEAIGLYQAGGQIFGSSEDNLNIRAQIKNLALLRGWIPEIKLSGSVSFEKSLTLDVFSRIIKKLIYGSLALTGFLSKSLSFSLSGSLTFIGVPVKKLFSGLLGSLSFSGDIDTPFWETFYQSCSGAISFSQTLSQKIINTCSGAISFSQTLSQKVKKVLFASLDFFGISFVFKAGVALCLLTYTEIQSLTFSAVQSYTYGLHYLLRIGGLLFPSSTLLKKAESHFSGTISFSGSFVSEIKIVLSGALNSTGVLVNAIKIFLSGSLSYSGVIIRKIENFILSGALILTGKALKSGYTSFVDLLRKIIQVMESED